VLGLLVVNLRVGGFSVGILLSCVFAGRMGSIWYSFRSIG